MATIGIAPIPADAHKQCDERITRLAQRLPLMQILFVRSANSPFITPGALQRGPAGDADSKRDISQVGLKQCDNAAFRFFSKLDNVALILHSTAVRTKKTGQLVFAEQCRSLRGNAPILPVQRLYPGSGSRFRGEFNDALIKTEEAFQRLGNVPLARYYEDPDVHAAFKLYALHVLHEILELVEPKLLKDQDERFQFQLMVFGHGVYNQAIALYAAELLFHTQQQKDVILNATVEELEVIQVDRRHSKYHKAIST